VKYSSCCDAGGCVVGGQNCCVLCANYRKSDRIGFKSAGQRFWDAAFLNLVALGSSDKKFREAVCMGIVFLEVHAMHRYSIWNSKVVCLHTTTGHHKDNRYE